MGSMKKDLTQLEIMRLSETFNLTDGHAHRNLNVQEQAIVDSMGSIFFEVEREQQHDLEAGYVSAYYDLLGQTIDRSKTHYLLLPSASISLELVANFLRLNDLRVALIEPCFDNIANMFERHDVELEAIPEKYLEASASEFNSFLCTLQADAICIVSPNNPTGVYYTQQSFQALVDFCQKQGKILILDTSFRVYKDVAHIFDEYAILQQSGIEYMVIEDTGKTWPTKDMKISILAISNGVYGRMFDIYTDFIYHHSPFVVRLLTRFAQNSKLDRLESVKGCVEKNRKALYDAIAGSPLIPSERPCASVAWLHIGNGMSANDIVEMLAKKGVFVLPGYQFFWNDESKGDSYIRISLVRDPELFARAAVIIHGVCRSLRS
jgi:aspartate/methionine/tyrosine aminotransferase